MRTRDDGAMNEETKKRRRKKKKKKEKKSKKKKRSRHDSEESTAGREVAAAAGAISQAPVTAPVREEASMTGRDISQAPVTAQKDVAAVPPKCVRPRNRRKPVLNPADVPKYVPPKRNPVLPFSEIAASSQVRDEAEPSSKDDEADPVNFCLSGALNRDRNTGNMRQGVQLTWAEPADAAVPKSLWRLYVFKNDQIIDTLHIHRQSAYLIGRERRAADIPADHESLSKQHAVLQFRLKETVVPGSLKPPERSVRPYILDLESTNGTYLNGKKLPQARYTELFEQDVLKFGFSTREYVLMQAKED